MPTTIVILVGAGASYAAGDYPEPQRPPLTKHLFDRNRAGDLLRTYTLAREAGRAIDRQMRADTTVQFEEALRQLRTDGYLHHAQMAAAVPPFLQALMLGYSEQLNRDPLRYGVLVDELLKLRTNLIFVSLNYDTLLDNRLAAFSPLAALDDYLDAPLGWSLIKPHGSVCWYVEQPAQFDPKAPADIPLVQAPIGCVPTTEFNLRNIRQPNGNDPHGATVRYPAIAMPDGPKDELVLPPGHLAHLRARLASREIYLLVLGYSALDTEILALIKQGGCKIRRMTIVNADAAAGLEVFERVTESGLKPIWPDVFDGSYDQWVDGDGLERWVAEFEKQPESATEPEDLRRILAERQPRGILDGEMEPGENLMTERF